MPESLKRLGNKIAHLFSGSFNLSNHYQNAESQFYMVNREDSKIIQGTIDSIRSQPSLRPSVVLDYDLAFTKNVIADLTGHTDLEIKDSDATEFKRVLRDQNYDEAVILLEKVYSYHTDLIKKEQLSSDQFKQVTTIFRKFLEFFKNNVGESERKYLVNNRKFKALTQVLLREKLELSDDMLISAIDQLFWKPDWSNTEGRKKIREISQRAWKEMGFKGDPPPWKDWEGSERRGRNAPDPKATAKKPRSDLADAVGHLTPAECVVNGAENAQPPLKPYPDSPYKDVP